MVEIWAGGEKVADWAHSDLPAVGDSIIISAGNGDEAAEVIKVAGSWDKFGTKTMLLTVVITGAI